MCTRAWFLFFSFPIGAGGFIFSLFSLGRLMQVNILQCISLYQCSPPPQLTFRHTVFSSFFGKNKVVEIKSKMFLYSCTLLRSKGNIYLFYTRFLSLRTLLHPKGKGYVFNVFCCVRWLESFVITHFVTKGQKIFIDVCKGKRSLCYTLCCGEWTRAIYVFVTYCFFCTLWCTQAGHTQEMV